MQITLTEHGVAKLTATHGITREQLVKLAAKVSDDRGEWIVPAEPTYTVDAAARQAHWEEQISEAAGIAGGLEL